MLVLVPALLAGANISSSEGHVHVPSLPEVSSPGRSGKTVLVLRDCARAARLCCTRPT